MPLISSLSSADCISFTEWLCNRKSDSRGIRQQACLPNVNFGLNTKSRMCAMCNNRVLSVPAGSVQRDLGKGSWEGGLAGAEEPGMKAEPGGLS